MLPRVKIDFSNGALGSTSPSEDCVAGLIATATAVADTFVLGNAYILYKFSDLTSLGVTDKNNAFLYKQVQEFYNQAGDGAELWLMGAPSTAKPSDVVDKDNALIPYAKNLIQVTNGRLRFLGVAYEPASGYQATVQKGLDSDVMTAALKAQTLAEWATTSLYAPLFVVLAGRGFANANIAQLEDLTQKNYNRVGILIGDTVKESEGAAVGLLLGKLATCPVQRSIARVKDGALSILQAYIGDKDASVANAETIHNKGYITFRTFTGKSGYFFSDDCLATSESDDYRFITRRRTIDKAYRITYSTMLEKLCDEIAVTDEGNIVPSVAKAWESDVVADIAGQMTAAGELGTDPTNDDDYGVQCSIDTNQKIIATSLIKVVTRVKPYGYSKYINVELGFTTTKTEN